MNKNIYVVLNRPYGYLSQFTGEENQKTLKEFNLPKDIYVAGRLDQDSEGLLILTNDGPFIKQLLDPDHGHERIYLAQVDGIPEPEGLKKLEEGIIIQKRKTRPCKVELLPETFDLPPRDPPIRVRKNIPTRWLKLTLIEGKNRQVRRMTAAISHPTLRLIRVQIGKIKIEDVPTGQWKFVQKSDIL